LLPLLLAALAAPGPDAGSLAAPFLPGEQLSYQVTILGATAGTAQLAVGAATSVEGLSTWPIVAQASSLGAVDRVFPIHDHDVSWWSPPARRGVVSRLVAAEGSNHYGFIIRFLPGASGLTADYRHWDGKGAVHKTVPLPAGTLDFLAAVYWLRTRPLALGERDSVPVYMGNDVWPLSVHVLGRQTIGTPAGAIPCVHVSIGAHMTGPFGNRRDLDAWFSDDPRHLPVLLDSEMLIGHLRAMLTKVEGAPLIGPSIGGGAGFQAGGRGATLPAP
jgi:hypothetical protein